MKIAKMCAMLNPRELIKPGDTVSVNVNGGMSTISHSAELLHMPVATGDSWIIRDVATGDVSFISEGCTITKRGQDFENARTDGEEEN